MSPMTVPPLSGTGKTWSLLTGGRLGVGVWGDLFIDGSCTRNPVRELSRAASSVYMVDVFGELLAEFRAPVRGPRKAPARDTT